MFSAPAVVVHGIGQVRVALAAGRRVVLVSAPGAALYAGCGWWMALMALARDEFPGLVAADLLDCADAPGRAMEALRAGQRALVLDGRCPGFAAVAAGAGTVGAIVLPCRPACLDLGDSKAARRLADWLERDFGGPLR